MNCEQLTNHIDEYMDGSLDAADSAGLERHVASCDACRQTVERERRLRCALENYGETSMPAPAATFYDQALLQAAHRGDRQQRRQSWLRGFGSAVAAGLALWVMSSVLLTSPELDGVDAAIPAVTMALEVPRTVNLVFSSADSLDRATLTVSLPEGIEIAGFEGQREISWVTSLRAGQNVLPLKLIATSSHGGELMATLQHRDDDKSFRLQVTVI